MPLFGPRDWPRQANVEWNHFAYTVSEWSRVARLLRSLNEIPKIQKILNKATSWMQGYGKKPTSDDLSTLNAEMYNFSKSMDEIRELLDSDVLPATAGLQEWLEHKIQEGRP